MSERKTKVIELFDDSTAIDASESLVFSTTVVTDLTDEQVIHEVLMDGEVADALSNHNAERVDMINQDILERTGNEVYLKPVKLKDLRWNIR